MWASQEGHTYIAKWIIEAKGSVDLQSQVYKDDFQVLYITKKLLVCEMNTRINLIPSSFPVTN